MVPFVHDTPFCLPGCLRARKKLWPKISGVCGHCSFRYIFASTVQAASIQKAKILGLERQLLGTLPLV